MANFFNFLKSKKPEESGELSPNPIEMATAVLLIEMARADFDQAENENELIVHVFGTVLPAWIVYWSSE